MSYREGKLRLQEGSQPLHGPIGVSSYVVPGELDDLPSQLRQLIAPFTVSLPGSARAVPLITIGFDDQLGFRETEVDPRDERTAIPDLELARCWKAMIQEQTVQPRLESTLRRASVAVPLRKEFPKFPNTSSAVLGAQAQLEAPHRRETSTQSRVESVLQLIDVFGTRQIDECALRRSNWDSLDRADVLDRDGLRPVGVNAIGSQPPGPRYLQRGLGVAVQFPKVSGGAMGDGRSAPCPPADGEQRLQWPGGYCSVCIDTVMQTTEHAFAAPSIHRGGGQTHRQRVGS